MPKLESTQIERRAKTICPDAAFRNWLLLAGLALCCSISLSFEALYVADYREVTAKSAFMWLSLLGLWTNSFLQYRFVHKPLRTLVTDQKARIKIIQETFRAKETEFLDREHVLEAKQVQLEDSLRDNQLIAENLQIATTRLQKVLSTIPIAYIGVDTSGNVYEWNDAAQKTFGYNQFEVFEQPVHEFIVGLEDREEFVSRLQQAIYEDQANTFALPCETKIGNRVTIEWNVMPMRSAKGEVTSILMTAVDITERVQQELRLRDMAFKDALTGLFNRRAFLNTLQDQWDCTPDSNISVVLMDVDKFKVYNDTYGHPAGDALLRRVGELISQNCGESVTPGRYGGEEFIMLLPEHNAEEAFEFADEVRKCIEAYTLDLHGATASFGVSSAIPGTITTAELIEQADKALYASKHNGRNQCTIWHPGLESDQPKAA